MATIKRTKGQTTIYKITHKTKDRVKGTPPTTGIELIVPEEQAVSLPHVVNVLLLFSQSRSQLLNEEGTEL